jgi:hypothetical protein
MKTNSINVSERMNVLSWSGYGSYKSQTVLQNPPSANIGITASIITSSNLILILLNSSPLITHSLSQILNEMMNALTLNEISELHEMIKAVSQGWKETFEPGRAA